MTEASASVAAPPSAVGASPPAEPVLPLAAWLRGLVLSASQHAAALAVGLATVSWAAGFSYLAVVRHLAGGSNAEDLGFTDQVLWNFAHRAQWFRMSIYNGATWNTELDISRIARPDSLLAFHVEPMLLLLVPIYTLGGGAVALLIVQALALAAGAIPAYRLGRYLSNSAPAGTAVAAVYLLSPLGQWAVLSDFHTSTLAAPLLLLSVERLVVGRSPLQSLLSAGLAVSAREDVGPAVAILGCMLLLRRQTRRTGLALSALGVGWTVIAALVIRSYSGGISPFDVRYGPTIAQGMAGIAAALGRPAVVGYAQTPLLSGGWLALIAPLAVLPALPSLALNALSTSPWMAAGKAHYSGLVLPFIVLGTAAALARLRLRPRLQTVAVAGLAATCVVAYLREGAGPFGGNYAPATLTLHAARAAELAASLPPDAAVSASAALVPRVSERARVYEFPSIEDAQYVFLDVKASPAPTSAEDVYLRAQALLAGGEWRLQTSDDGLMLLERAPGAAPVDATSARDIAAPGDAPVDATSAHEIAAPGALVPPALLSAELVPSPDGAIDVDGPRWVLRTTWQVQQPLPSGTRPDFWITLEDGEQLHLWDIADVWWNPPDRLPADQVFTIDVPNIPVRQFRSWQATWTQNP